MTRNGEEKLIASVDNTLHTLCNSAAQFTLRNFKREDTNPSRKQSFPKTLFKPEESENADVLVWTENNLKTELFENDDIAIIM